MLTGKDVTGKDGGVISENDVILQYWHCDCDMVTTKGHCPVKAPVTTSISLTIDSDLTRNYESNDDRNCDVSIFIKYEILYGSQF